ncbi:hypothetical protein RB5545 [Rhodopirellula baltica SH 1]|uniref:Uncharacterized protein n=1 Tax=Rhodopirellula baltica (strain DSM 10527 / NCIMB 13988 / SH1) TaxID=243090 RepID=Q7URP1_RHOBA|nr:hypothetical protein RB5545 [Rhodopirellula baltica SH 1]
MRIFIAEIFTGCRSQKGQGVSVTEVVRRCFVLRLASLTLAKVVQFYFTLPLGGADRFGPGRVTRWIQCRALPSLCSTLPRGR